MSFMIVPVYHQRHYELGVSAKIDGNILRDRAVSFKIANMLGCFKDNANFKDQANRWHKTLKGMFHQAFRKIRVTENKPKPDEIAILMEQKKQLKVEIARCQDDDKKEALEKQMFELDATLASF